MKLSTMLVPAMLVAAMAAGCDKKITVVVTNARNSDVQVAIRGPGEIKPAQQTVLADGGQAKFHIKVMKNELPANYFYSYDGEKRQFTIDEKHKGQVHLNIPLTSEKTFGEKPINEPPNAKQQTVPKPDK